jgi:hypothetical protein
MQVSLYARYAPTYKRPERSDPRSSSKFVDGNTQRKIFDPELLQNGASSSTSSSFASPYSPSRQKQSDSEFLHFLKNSIFAPLEFALKECEKRKPPLFSEMVFILGKLGKNVLCAVLCCAAVLSYRELPGQLLLLPVRTVLSCAVPRKGIRIHPQNPILFMLSVAQTLAPFRACSALCLHGIYCNML